VVAVRDAGPADARAIAAIYNQGIEERTATFESAPRTAADIEDWLGAGERLPVLVAEDDRGVRGWARIAPYSERAAYAGVGEVSAYVERSARGRGIGRALLARGWPTVPRGSATGSSPGSSSRTMPPPLRSLAPAAGGRSGRT
jgi:L-amino acid N-acyltransferase YncA